MPFNSSALQLPTLKNGSDGNAVLAWQKFLFDQGLPMINFDSDFGPLTDQSTREYQKDNGLTETGIVDTTTYAKALQQGFAVYFAVYTQSVKKLLAYLNFTQPEVEDLQKSLTAIATLSPALKVDGDFGTNSTRGLAAAYRKLDTGFRAKLETQLSSATKSHFGSDLDAVLDTVTACAKRLREQLSGKEWVKKFPTSRSIDDLASPFRQKVQNFEQALVNAGANIDIAATLRPSERAHLMHYSFKINKGTIAAKDVPSKLNVDINWIHYNDADSRQAAKEMVAAYNIAFEPALTSRHIQGLAIDWDITWSGTLDIKNASGTTVAVGSPRSGDSNSTLWAVGRTYGVIKLTSDPPHWSNDGR